MIDIGAAQNSANQLREAANKISAVVNDIEKAQGDLKAGATTNKIKVEIDKLEAMKNALSPKVGILYTTASSIVSIANQIRREEEEAARKAAEEAQRRRRELEKNSG